MARILGESLDDLRRTRTSLKWRAFPDDVLPAWVAEMDARPCQPVVEAVTAAVARGDTGYPVVGRRDPRPAGAAGGGVHAAHLGVIAQTAAWTRGDAWLDQLRDEIVDNRRLLASLLASTLPEVVATPADATYLAWLDCRGLGLDDPAAAFLERGRVALSGGTRYDRTASGWVRFNLGTSPAVITEAVQRMAASV